MTQDLDAFISSFTPPPLLRGDSKEVATGVALQQNVRNEFAVVTLHYSAHPLRRPGTEAGDAWVEQEMRKLGCYRICRPCDRMYGIETLTCGECEENLETILSNKWRREHEIDYQAHSGSFVFDTFTRARNTCEPFRIPSAWRRWRAMDYGYRNPTAVLWIALDPDGHTWVYHEYYEKERTVDYHAQKIHTISAYIDAHILGTTESDVRAMTLPSWEPTEEFRRLVTRTYRTVGDPSMDRRTQKDMNTVLSRFRQNGLYIKKANNAMAGLETIANSFTNGTCTIFNTCTNLITEIENLVWAEHADPSKNQKERPVDRNDHAVDALRYYFNEFGLPQTTHDESDDTGISPEERAWRERHQE